MLMSSLLALAVAEHAPFGTTSFFNADSYAAPIANSGGPYGYQPQPQPQPQPQFQVPVIQKHIYVHVPPPEPEIERIQQQISVPAPRKHYKIVFIKAPAPATPTAPIIPAFAQDEQKTLIYVLVKKPEDQLDINIPTPAPTQPSKPEVYFIRYKTQKDTPTTYGPPAVVQPPTTRYGPPAPVPSSRYGVPTGYVH